MLTWHFIKTFTVVYFREFTAVDARVMKMLIHDGRNVMVLTDNLSETKQLNRDVMNKSAQNQVKETHVIHLLLGSLLL